MLFAAVGVHPTEAGTWTDQTSAELRNLLKPSGSSDTSSTSKIVAIGEIGLDYYWDSAPHDLQKNILRMQLALAAEAGLPVILHMREAGDAPHGNCAGDLLQILEEWVLGAALREESAGRTARSTAFLLRITGNGPRRASSLGFCIGVTGPVTFENAARRQEIVAALPLDQF